MNIFDGGWWASVASDGFSHRNLALLLWAGLAVLTISLLVLSRTRWGQAQPMAKCVFLSIYAHLLMGGYAYTTRLFVEPPPRRFEQTIHLTHVAAGADEGETSARSRPDPWERLAAETATAPQLDSPQRQDAAPLVEPSRMTAPAERDSLAMAPSDAAPSVEPDRPDPEAPPAPETTIIAAAAPPSEIEQPAPAPPSLVEAPTPEMPRPGQLARVDVPAPGETPARRSDSADLPRELFDAAGGLQRITDALPAELADAARGDRDELAEAPNREGNAEENILAAGDPLAVGGVGALRISSSGRPDVGAALEAMPIPRRLGDGAEMPDLYRLRVGDGRALAARQLGATRETEAAVEEALRWLAANQSPDGHWDAGQHGAGREDKVLGHDRGGAGARAHTAVTGLALLAFLGAGHTHLEGEYRTNVQHGLEYLLRTQRGDGDLSGDAEFFARMYCHGMASLALSEALALTGDRRLQPYVERGVAFSLSCQHPTDGGWRYQKGDRGDMSQFGWQVMALKSAELAGIPIPRTTRDGMNRFLGAVTSGMHSGLASYRGGERASRTMTAEALACRYFLDGPPGPNLRREAVGFIMEEPPQDGRANFYYWYYATLALFQTQDDNWTSWNAALQEQLLSRQRDDGEAAGSWDPNTVWGGYGGRVYTTATACLCLEVYYRYLPITAQQ
ncbi:MAG: squalene--hopene cyclase [Planctomycetes bacterium]|nr:squalene--hopene cyclase [Planctomycetota bacterium]